MFEISDVLVDKQELAMALNIELNIPDDTDNSEEIQNNISVSEYLNSVSKTVAEGVVQKVGKILSLQGFPCSSCPKTEYILLPLSECKETSLSPIKSVNSENLRFLLVLRCSGEEIFKFDVTMKRSEQNGK